MKIQQGPRVALFLLSVTCLGVPSHAVKIKNDNFSSILIQKMKFILPDDKAFTVSLPQDKRISGEVEFNDVDYSAYLEHVLQSLQTGTYRLKPGEKLPINLSFEKRWYDQDENEIKAEMSKPSLFVELSFYELHALQDSKVEKESLQELTQRFNAKKVVIAADGTLTVSDA